MKIRHIALVALAAALISSSVAAQEVSQPSTIVGSFFTDTPHGIVFMPNNQTAFHVRLGWAQGQNYHCTYGDLVGYVGHRFVDNLSTKFGASTADESYNVISWPVGEARVTFEWGRVGASGAVGRVKTDRPVKIALHASPTWHDFHSTYRAEGNLIIGTAKLADASSDVTWRMKANLTPCALANGDFADVAAAVVGGKSTPAPASPQPGSPQAALVYDITPAQPLEFSASLGEMPPMDKIDETLDAARAKYEQQRLSSVSPLGDFLSAMMDNMGFERVYSPKKKIVAHVMSRGWSAPSAQNLWVWDSLLTAVMAAHEDPKGARDTVRALLMNQQPDGLIPNDMTSGPRQAGGLSIDRSQPPVGALCVWKIHQLHPDKAFLAEVYPKLVKWHRWWFDTRPGTSLPYRDGNRNGLLEWGTEETARDPKVALQLAKYESGLDDSPMYENGVMSAETRTMMLDDVGLSSLWAADAMYLALIADELGKTHDAEAFRKERADMAERINKLMWNDKLGIYCNRYWNPQAEGSKPAPNAPQVMLSERISPTNFYPMMADIPTKEQADKMVALLKDPKKFWGPYVCPTIARDDPAFPKQHYWRGKIWGPTNYLMFQGLIRYADADTLNQFADKGIALFMKSYNEDFTCHENYMSNGQGSSDPHYTWGALLCLIGLENDVRIETDGSVRLNGSGQDIEIRNLPLRGQVYDLVRKNGLAELKRDGKSVLAAKGEVVRDSKALGQ